MHQASLDKLQKLHPDIRNGVITAYSACYCALTGRAKPIIVYGWRTFLEQSGLYALGRTKVNPDGKTAKKPLGNIVTNAKAGQSIHNYALAWDIALLVDGKVVWDDRSDFDKDLISDWMECVKIFKSYGYEWGGDWTFVDKPHFQDDKGYSWQQLQVLHNQGKFLPGTQYLNLARQSSPDPSMYRTTASLNFRTAGSTAGAVIMVILKGELIRELSRSGTWSKIEYNGKTGYVSNQYLTK